MLHLRLMLHNLEWKQQEFWKLFVKLLMMNLRILKISNYGYLIQKKIGI